MKWLVWRRKDGFVGVTDSRASLPEEVAVLDEAATYEEAMELAVKFRKGTVWETLP